MIHTIQNDYLTVAVAEHGAELRSIRDAQGTEFLWQGDPKYWGDQSPMLFPFVGRLTNNSYKYMGKVYPMSIHGFAASSDFSVAEKADDCIVLELKDSSETLAQYPFTFTLQITYALTENALQVTYRVENRDGKTMPFGIGGHPGFNVPLDAGEMFEDYELQFSCPCQPDRVGFSRAVYLNGHDEAYPLREDRFIDLKHDLFIEDAVILKNMAREVTLRSKRSGKGVTVSYPDMPYLGIWHWPQTDAPYVCIEPWSSLPSRQDVVEEFSCKSDLIQLTSDECYETTWSVSILGQKHNSIIER